MTKLKIIYIYIYFVMVAITNNNIDSWPLTTSGQNINNMFDIICKPDGESNELTS